MIIASLLAVLPATPLPFAAQDFGPPNHLVSSCEFLRQIQAHDMDGDGDEDIVVLASDGTVRWFRSDGAGNIVGVEGIASGLESATACTVADLDGDGDLDVMIPDPNDGRVTWRRNDGRGRFGAEELVFQQLAVRSDAGAVDVDSDGDLDVLYPGSGSSSAQLAWRANDGNGGFGPERLLGSGPSNRPTPYDVDGDGDLDVLALNGNYELGWWENLGLGSYVPTMIGPEPIADFGMSDLDGDGDLDLYTASRQASAGYPVQVRANDGQGQLGSPMTVFTSGEPSLQIVLLDVNDDGTEDLVTSLASSREVLWSRGLGSLAFAAPEVLYALDWAPSLATLDMDSDGDMDLAVGRGSQQGFSRLELGENTGTAPYLELRDVMEATVTALAAHLVDLDGDGDRDLVWGRSTDRIIAHENLGSGALGLHYGPARVLVEDLPGRERSITSADMDGDGVLDLVVAAADTGSAARVGWYRNLGGFQLGQRRRLQGGDTWRSEVSVADLDGDGLGDVLLTGANSDRIVWQRNLGGGQFGSAITLTTAVDEAWDAKAGDLDGDGDLDIAYVGKEVIGWMQNNGSAGFGPPTAIFQSTSLQKGRVLCADVDGDGDDDLIARSLSFGPAYAIHEALGGGAFRGPVDLDLEVSFGAIEVVDVDGDGDLDFLANGSDGVALLENLGAGSLAAPRTVLSGIGPSSVFQAADADGDGDLDLLRLNGDLQLTVLTVHEGLRVFGSDVCGPAVPNSSGAPGELTFAGSPVLGGSGFDLGATALPTFSFGYFLVGDAPDLVPQVSGSQGTLCIGGSIGRFVGPGQIQSSGASGTLSLTVDLLSIPLSAGPAASSVGDNWYFQAWYRDANPTATSNFTSARSMLVQ